MTESECAEVTRRFYRGNGAGQVAEGNGLGLALVDRIVDKHGGTLHLDSASEEGTRVAVRLPAASPPDGANPSSAPPERPKSSPVAS